MEKRFIFTIDDNIRFLQELTENNSKTLFAHPYVNLLKELHETYGVKVQLNLFFQNETFTLAQMTDKYKKEWDDNADWLKLSFHSKLENVLPYQNSNYAEVYEDCKNVQAEILRFAGEKSLAKTTTVHYCQTTLEGLQALKDNGVKGLLGLFGTLLSPENSYQLPKHGGEKIRQGEIFKFNETVFAGIDVILNSYSPKEIIALLEGLKHRNFVKIMIHEQYFYTDYVAYQPDFKLKLEKAFSFLTENGFTSCFFEEML